MWRMHRAVPAALVVVLAGLTACGAEDQSPDPGEESAQAQGRGDEAASASCASGITEVSDATVAPGESIVVSSDQQGLAECLAWSRQRDRGDATPGSFPSERPDVAPEPDQPVVWQQDSAETVLATADPNSDGVFELSVTIPDDAQSGAAEIAIGFAGPATVTVENQSPNPGDESGQAQGRGDETATDISAACAKPVTEVSDATVAPGESIVVSAQGMWDGCSDHLGVDVKELPAELPEVPPEADQPVVWRRGSAESVLATGDANSDGVFEMSVTIPEDAQQGTADITIGTAQSATVTVEPQN